MLRLSLYRPLSFHPSWVPGELWPALPGSDASAPSSRSACFTPDVSRWLPVLVSIAQSVSAIGSSSSREFSHTTLGPSSLYSLCWMVGVGKLVKELEGRQAEPGSFGDFGQQLGSPCSDSLCRFQRPTRCSLAGTLVEGLIEPPETGS
jgi:hypothetical protein